MYRTRFSLIYINSGFINLTDLLWEPFFVSYISLAKKERESYIYERNIDYKYYPSKSSSLIKDLKDSFNV